MAIVQEAYCIPDDITTGLATGLYRRTGSVVRYASGPKRGRIIKHLEPIELKVVEQAQGVGSKALQFLKNHKKGVGIVVIGTAVLGASVYGFRKWKNREPEELANFHSAMKRYIEAIRQGKMNIGIISELMQALDTIKQHEDYEKITIQLTAEELGDLVGQIYAYTIKLAADNAVELTEDELRLDGSEIVNLQSCLETQKRIFEEAA